LIGGTLQMVSATTWIIRFIQDHKDIGFNRMDIAKMILQEPSAWVKNEHYLYH